MAAIETNPPVKALTVEDARRLTDDIRSAMEMIWEKVRIAYVGRAWAALDYASWEDYCTAEFQMGRLRLTGDDRAAVVFSLWDSGLSTRAIVAATGLSKGTVARELAGAPNGAPESVTGTDGKTYSALREPGESPPVDSRSPAEDLYRRTRQSINPNIVVRATYTALAGMLMSFDLVNLDKVDQSVINEWAPHIKESVAALSRFSKELTRRAQVKEV